MNFNDYQKLTKSTAIYPGAGEGNLAYPTLGLASEAGEVANKVKKVIRDSNGVATEEVKATISSEIGDVLWYVARLADELGLSLNDIAQANLDKLQSRQQRGTLSGSGDNR